MNLEQYSATYADMVPHINTLRRLAFDAPRILELGVRGGVSTWALLDGLRSSGEMTSVDTEDVLPLLPDRVTTDRHWRFVQGDDRVVDLPQADLVFIDTSHEYTHTLVELDRVADTASVIALHDWNLPPVEDAVRRFCSRTRWYISEVEQSPWGLVVLR